MNKMLTGHDLRVASDYQSRFERLEPDLRRERSLHAQLGKRLRQIYESPGSDSEPHRFRTLLGELEGTLDRDRAMKTASK